VFAATVPALLGCRTGHRCFRGRASAAETASVGEVVFTTALTGVSGNLFTDPSYAGQGSSCWIVSAVGSSTGVSPRRRRIRTGFFAASGHSRPCRASHRIGAEHDRIICRTARRRALVGISDIDTRKLTGFFAKRAHRTVVVMRERSMRRGRWTVTRAVPSMAGLDLRRSSAAPNPTPGRGERGERQRLSQRRRTPRSTSSLRLWHQAKHSEHACRARCKLTVVPAQTMRAGGGAAAQPRRRVPVERTRRSGSLAPMRSRRSRIHCDRDADVPGIAWVISFRSCAVRRRIFKMKLGTWRRTSRARQGHRSSLDSQPDTARGQSCFPRRCPAPTWRVTQLSCSTASCRGPIRGVR